MASLRSDRMVQESPVHQGHEERIARSLNTTPWGPNPTDVEVKIYDMTGVDLSATCLSGSPSVAGNVITTPFVVNLTAGKVYRLEVMFTTGGNVLSPFCYIIGET